MPDFEPQRCFEILEILMTDGSTQVTKLFELDLRGDTMRALPGLEPGDYVVYNSRFAQVEKHVGRRQVYILFQLNSNITFL